MNDRVLIAILVAASVGLSACGKSEEPAEAQKAPETGAVEEAKTMAEQAVDATKKGADKASEKASEMTSTAMEKGAEMADAAVAQAEDLIQKAKEYIDNNQIDLAQEAMNQLRSLKDALPESLQAQIDKLEEMLSSAPAPGQ